MDSFLLRERVVSDLTGIFWTIIVAHWQAHIDLSVADLQSCYKVSDGTDDHFLLASFWARMSKTQAAEGLKVLQVDPRSLQKEVARLIYENIAFLHAAGVSDTDMVVRRGMLKVLLRDQIATCLLPNYAQLLAVNKTPNVTHKQGNKKQEEKRITPASVTEKDKEKTTGAKHSRKDILKTIEAEVAIGDEQRQRFNSKDYAELNDLLEIV